MVTQMKDDVLALLDSENDGVRTHAIKFTESLIITLSPRTSDSDVPKRQESDTSLDKVPRDHSYVRYGMLGILLCGQPFESCSLKPSSFD